MITLWKILIVIFGVYAALAVYVYFMQSRMIFLPDMPGRKLEATPQSIGLRYTDVRLVTEDNVSLHGWFIPHEHARATLVFFHGNAGNISHRLDSIDIFHALGLNVLIIDYRGYGQSEGKISEAGSYRDAEAAWHYLTRELGIPGDSIIIFGRSLGASVASWLASRHTPAALIVESGFSSITSMAERLYPWLPVRWISQFKYDTRNHVSNCSCPVLVIHSRQDEIIPYDEGLLIYQSAAEPKQFLEITGGHNDGFISSGAAYINGIRAFLGQYL